MIDASTNVLQGCSRTPERSAKTISKLQREMVFNWSRMWPAMLRPAIWIRGLRLPNWAMSGRARCKIWPKNNETGWKKSTIWPSSRSDVALGGNGDSDEGRGRGGGQGRPSPRHLRKVQTSCPRQLGSRSRVEDLVLTDRITVAKEAVWQHGGHA